MTKLKLGRPIESADKIFPPYHRQTYCRQKGECKHYSKCSDQHNELPKVLQKHDYLTYTGFCYEPKEESEKQTYKPSNVSIGYGRVSKSICLLEERHNA